MNVGDLKPMEFPIEFFLDFAWNPQRWPARESSENLPGCGRRREFGPTHAAEIADLMAKYTKYNGRRKPELAGSGELQPDGLSGSGPRGWRSGRPIS